MMKTRYIFILALLVMVISVRYASAAFINGIERFDGTVKDTITWEEYVPPWGGFVSQNNKLLLNLAPANIMDYTTRSVTVGVGEIVTVELLGHPQEGAAESGLWLTTNSEGTNKYTQGDSHFIGVELETGYPDSGFHTWVSDPEGGYWGWMFAEVSSLPSPQEPYILEIERISSNSARFSAYNSDMTLIGSAARGLPDMPGNLYISMSAWSQIGDCAAIFDNVTIIPEPATLLLLGLGGLAVVRRRRNSN